MRRAAPVLSVAAVLVLSAAGASPAAAASPWWHLTSGTRAASIQPGSAKDEVLRVTVEGTPGHQFLLSNLTPHEVEEGEFENELGEARYAEFPVGASAAAVQAGLTEAAVFGAGNVEVAEAGPDVYELTFTGQLSYLPINHTGQGAQPLPYLNTELSPTPLSVTEIAHGAADGEIYVAAENLGESNAGIAGSAVIIADSVPPGLRAVTISGTSPAAGLYLLNARQPLSCSLASLSCEFNGSLAPFDQLEVNIGVVAEGFASGTNSATISGGGAPSASVTQALSTTAGAIPFGIENYELRAEEEGGVADRQAGSHPFQLSTTVTLNQTAARQPAALAKDVAVNLPPGLVGNATVTPQCTSAQFYRTVAGVTNACPPQTAVGAASLSFYEPASGSAQLAVPVFNLEPGFGEPARFGFYAVTGNVPVIIDTALRSDGDYGITANVTNITQTAALLSSTVTLWGAPQDPRHDSDRGWGCILLAREPGREGVSCPGSSPSQIPAFLSLPTSCNQSTASTASADSWLAPGAFATVFDGSAAGALEGCNQLAFGPAVDVQPTTREAASASGLGVTLDLKQEGLGSATGRAESAVKKVTVALPAGITTNPAVANGLSACTLAQYKAEELGNQSCPESSKVGEVEIETPLVKPMIRGSVYVAKQHDNPADNLLSIYMVAKNPELGILVKSAGAVTPDPQTGQLTTTFDELPQLPFSHFHFVFRSGPRAPLITPGLCGRYTTGADLYPYSNPGVPLHREATFEISSGANGTPCSTRESQLPNKPTLEAGSASPIAGAYAPFIFKVKRTDGSQTLSSIDATLPEGLLGKLAGVNECSNAAIAQAQARSGEGQGALELALPSCPASSQVGVVNVGTGVGTQPYYVQGKAYLAGPYKGAPLSLAIVTPAVVGPFDLGTIVVRTALYVNETTAQITAKSDPIPTIVHGLPTVVQSIALNMNRPSFTLNPTSCDPKQIEGSATSTLGNVAPLSQRFQVGACNALNFAPKLALNLKGGTRRHTFPALKATLTYPKGSYANIKRAQVTLPHSEFLEQGHIGTVCTRVQFAAKACPRASIYGRAMAISPLLDKPVSGPVYLRSSSNKLPDLVAELNGQIDVTLDGKIDTGKGGGIRNTFQAVPDAPVSKFVLELKGGKKGLLVNSENICAKEAKTTAIADFTAQNGKVHNTSPTVTNSCPKKSKGNKSKAGKKRRTHR